MLSSYVLSAVALAIVAALKLAETTLVPAEVRTPAIPIPTAPPITPATAPPNARLAPKVVPPIATPAAILYPVIFFWRLVISWNLGEAAHVLLVVVLSVLKYGRVYSNPVGFAWSYNP